MNAELNYYPTDREIMAAKVSEIVAECIRVSDEMPEGQELGFNLCNSHTVCVDYVINGKFACGFPTRCQRAYMDWPNGSYQLDLLLAWVRSFGDEDNGGQLSLDIPAAAGWVSV